MATPLTEFCVALERHAPKFGIEFQPEQVARLGDYYGLLLKWNAQLHLFAPCAPSEFATRHVLESLSLLKHLPLKASIVDVGSGGGLPIIPCLLVRDDLKATLIESSQRKSVFLREAVRGITAPDRVRLLASRFQDVSAPQAEFLTCRALDRFRELLPELVRWAPSQTFLIFAGESLREPMKRFFACIRIERLPLSDKRYLIFARHDT